MDTEKHWICDKKHKLPRNTAEVKKKKKESPTIL